jgi:hypothetical protein
MAKEQSAKKSPIANSLQMAGKCAYPLMRIVFGYAIAAVLEPEYQKF